MAGETAEQRRVLGIALALNAAMFVVEVTSGLLGGSIALVAEGLDNLADASAYAVAMLAIARGALFKARAATLTGALLLLLGLGLLVEVGRRAVYGAEPEGLLMLVVATLSLAMNATVMRMLGRFREGDVHLRATWLFTRADVIANLALIASGLIVLATGFGAIDLIVGAGIGLYVTKEAVEILREARAARRRPR